MEKIFGFSERQDSLMKFFDKERSLFFYWKQFFTSNVFFYVFLFCSKTFHETRFIELVSQGNDDNNENKGLDSILVRLS